MKSCESCHRLFPADGGFCPVDGNRLTPVADATVPTDPEDKRVGGTFCAGRYQIWRRVADGGMGRVYEALDLQANRGVAMKILHADVADDAVSLARFKREFECSASLPHEYIVEVLAFEKTEDGSFGLVMEYLEGEELRMLLKRDKVLPPERVIRMLAQVALGLHAAHAKQVVHRDLKPDNIFLCGTNAGDAAKILDFGSVRDNSAKAKKLTVIGTTIGTPFYMAPEQAQALPTLDQRADVWSLAAIAYECLAGRVPFSARSGPAILLAILTEDPQPPSVLGAAHHVPVTLDPVMEEALAKDPKIRIPSVAALADRIGHAYGLAGSHEIWARTPQQELAEQIRVGLPGLLAKHAADTAVIPDAGRGLDDAFKGGGDVAAAAGTFEDDLVMGVPSKSPGWLIPAIIGGVLLVVAVVVVIVALGG